MTGRIIGAGAALCLVGLALFGSSLLLDQTGLVDVPRAVSWLAVATGSALAVLGALALLLGVTLYVLVPAFSGPERALKDYGSHRVVLACTLLAIVVGNLLAILYFIPAVLALPSGSPGADLGSRLLSPAGIAASALSLDVALLAVVYLRIVRPGAITWKTMGLTSRDLGSRLLLGLLFGLILFSASSLLEMLLTAAGVQQTQTQLFQSVETASVPEFGLVLLAGAVIAPVVEEIYFRGYVFRAYLDQKGLKSALFFSAGLFAIIHLNLPAVLPIFVMGLLLAYFYYRTSSVIPGIVAHGVNNAAAFLLLYLGLA